MRSEDPLTQYIYRNGTAPPVDYTLDFHSSLRPSLNSYFQLWKDGRRETLKSKELKTIADIAPEFDAQNHRLMLLTLRMLEWDRDKLIELENISGRYLRNHHLALDIWEMGSIVDKYKNAHFSKVSDVLGKFMEEYTPYHNLIADLPVTVTHQTSYENAEGIKTEGSILKTQNNDFKHNTGVSLGLFGCYNHWCEGETFTFELPLGSVQPVFVNTHIPRVAAYYPSALHLENPDTDHEGYKVYWPRDDNKYQRQSLLALYNEGIWQLQDVGQEKGYEVHYITTDQSYLMVTALCEVSGMSDCTAM